MRNVLLNCLFLILPFFHSVEAQFVSVASGGNYEDATTWRNAQPSLNGDVRNTLTIYGTVDRTGDMWVRDGSVYGNLNVKGNFSHTQGDVFYVRGGGRLEIWGDLTSTARIYVEKGGLLIVHGNLTDYNWGSFFAGNVVVTGNVYMHNTSVSTTGKLVVGGNLTIPGGGGSYKGDLYLMDPEGNSSTPGWMNVSTGNQDDFINKEGSNSELFDIVKDNGLVVERPYDSGLAANLVYWFRADQKVSGLRTVTKWGDLSGNRNHASSSYTGPEPLVSLGLNGQRALAFHGSNQLLLGNHYRINSGRGFDGDQRTMFIVFRTGNDLGMQNPQVIYEQGGASNGLSVFISQGKLYVHIYNDGNLNNSRTIFSDVAPASDYVLYFGWKQGILTGTLNGKLVGGVKANGSINSLKDHNGSISIGVADGTTRVENGESYSGKSFFEGQIAEMLYFDKMLSTVDVSEIYGRLRERYSVISSSDKIYYSYRSGRWDDRATWTHDAGGTTQTAVDIPGDGAKVVILTGRTVHMNAHVDVNRLSLAIREGAFLDMRDKQFINQLDELSGCGTLRLASVMLPSVKDNIFTQAGGGTVEYVNLANFTFPSSQLEYNHLVLNAPGVIATQLSNLTINGDLLVKQGTYQINNNTSNRRQLSVAGDLTINNGASMVTGTGNTNIGGNVSGGIAPFLNYYDTHSHRIVVYGNMTNDGTVRFTNQAYPVYNDFPNDGATTVYFMGAADKRLTCNGTTDFYNLVVDKGNDQTFKLIVYSSDYKNFRLFGRNDHGGDGGDGANPNLRKALWIRSGSLVLQGLTVIPSLSEGGGPEISPNSDFYIPVNGALVLDGPDVVVLSTADDYREVNAAYGVNGGTGSVNGVNKGTKSSAFSIYGKLQINNGYFSTRESGGFINWDKASGEFIVNGGTVDAKQYRAAGGVDGLASYTQNGGTVVFRGRYQRNLPATNSVAALVNATLNTGTSTVGLDGSVGVLNINNGSNIFNMSGGTIQILDGGDNGYAVDIFSDQKNINVTGGTLELLPVTNSSNLIIRSAAPFGNLVVKRSGGTSNVVLASRNPGVNSHLRILKHVSLQSGVFDAKGFDLMVGGDFTIANGVTYTTGANHTIFNGDVVQTFKFDVSSELLLHKLTIDKPVGQQLNLAGKQAAVRVADSLVITKGTLNDNGKTINLLGDLYNTGRHIGAGQINLMGTAQQRIGGDGTGEFQNLALNNANQNTLLLANTTINGVLTFGVDNRLLEIGTHNLKFASGASISQASNKRYIKVAGNAGDGGVTMTYTSVGALTFPVGVANYTPATLGFSSAPSTYGAITVVPVNYEHPVTKTKNRSLTYFWRVKSTGFTGFAGKVTHNFVYNQANVTGTEANYIGTLYNNSTYLWNNGTTASVDKTNKVISDWITPSVSANFIDGDYTAGEAGAFGEPAKFYSRRNGLWNEKATWSTTGHGGNQASRTPVAGDIVIIGSGHTVSLNANALCASVQIAENGVLDVRTHTGSNFGMVQGHGSVKNGKIRVTSGEASSSERVKVFSFPSGDFSDFNVSGGTTEFYTTSNNAANVYILPSLVTEYGNLILSPNGLDNLSLPNNRSTIIYGNLTCNSQHYNSWIAMSWNTKNWGTNIYNPTIEKVVTVKGNVYVNGGSLAFMNDYQPQHLVVNGDVVVANSDNARIITIGKDWLGGDVVSNSLSIGGSLINNSKVTLFESNKYVDLVFFGDSDAKITNTAGTPSTAIKSIIVNKGSSQSVSLTMDIKGAVNYQSDEWLTLKNGTFKYLREATVYLNTNNGFTIPKTAGLYLDTPNDFVMCYGNSNSYDVYLNGKLTVVNGRMYIGYSDNNSNNDIEYSGGGASELEIRGGSLFVNGQIRRNPASAAGILKYQQSGGTLTVNGRNALSTNAKLEVLNAGSVFNMSGGTIRIVRGGGGSAHGDLYLRPASSNVTGGTIQFENNGVGAQDYLLDANVPLNHLTVNGTSHIATVKLLTSPLTLKGDLTLNNGFSIFDANQDFNVDVTIKGDFKNSGLYNHRSNTTTFNGGVQQISGSSNTTFHNLVVHPVTSLTLNKGVVVNQDLSITRGTLAIGVHVVEVKRNLTNNSNYTDNGGCVLLKGLTQQMVSGTGSFGKLELDNAAGARTLNDITLQKDLILTRGLLDINSKQLLLGLNSQVKGNLGSSAMIVTNGVYSSRGVSKVFAPGSSTFTFPMGVVGKYTPAVVRVDASLQTASLRINNVNDNHPAVLNPNQVLNYFWEVESSGLSGFRGNVTFHYLQDDVQGDDASYLAARLLVPGTSWSKANSVNANTNVITFSFGGVDNMSGEYTAGNDNAFPAKVPEYSSKRSGDWSNPANWEQTGGDPYPCPAGGPNGFIVHILHHITADINYCQAYRTNIAAGGKLLLPASTYGHNLGSVSGSGTLYLEAGHLPEGKYENFLSCDTHSILEFGGSGDYTVIADLLDQVSNLTFSGTGRRVLPNKALTVCHQLLIDGPKVDNSVYNQSLLIKGTFVRGAGSFVSGSGSKATVSFVGSAPQSLGRFSGENVLNNVEVNNPSGLTLTGAVELKGNLLLTNGIITTTEANGLTILNTAVNCVTPANGKTVSYVNGPLTKRMNQSDSFVFPIGKDNVLGSKLQLSAVQTGTKLWTAQYNRPNPTCEDFDKIDPVTGLAALTAVNRHEYWSISTPDGGQAVVQLGWDASRDITPLMTEHGLADIRIAKYSSGKWLEVASSATGNNSDGVVRSSARLDIPAAGMDFTTATVNTNKPKVRFNTSGAVCGADGIPLELASTVPAPFNYRVSYQIDQVKQPDVVITSTDMPYVLPTPIPGEYQLLGFTYANGLATGVVDATPVVVFASPTAALAGADQSLIGASSVVLGGNQPIVGTGLWSIVSGSGGSFVDPTKFNTEFNGINGSSYVLRWSITNGDCSSSAEVSINFPFSSYLWEGTVSNDWNNPNNWRGKIIPNKDADVLIDHPGVRFDPVISGKGSVRDLMIAQGNITVKPGGQMTVEGDLTVRSGCQLILENDLANRPASFIQKGSVMGDVVVRVIYPETARNWYLGHPVNSSSDAYFNAGGFSLWSYAHSSTSEAWVTETAGKDYLSSTQGFISYNGSGVSKVVEHKGVLHAGDQSFNLNPNAKHRWNLVANPFNAYINPRKLNFGDIVPTIWYRTYVDKTYQFSTYNQEENLKLPYGESVLIAPMQAFWIRTENAGTLVFDVDALTHPEGNNPRLKSAAAPLRDVLYLQLVNDKTSDQTAIACRMTGHKAFAGNDSEKKLSGGVVPNLYSVKSGKSTAINIQPEEPDANGIQLGYSLGKDANKGLRIKAINIDDFMPNMRVYLEDSSTGLRVDLRANPEYAFTSDVKTDNKRFVLYFEKLSTGFDDEPAANRQDGSIRIYGEQGKAIVWVGSELLRQGNARVNIFNLAGNLMSTHRVVETRAELTLPDAPAIYLVEVEAGGQVKREKVVK